MHVLHVSRFKGVSKGQKFTVPCVARSGRARVRTFLGPPALAGHHPFPLELVANL